MKKKIKKNNKNVQPELIKITNEDTGEVFKFILILVGVALVTALLYFVSSRYLIKDGVTETNEPAEEEIEYTNVTGGTLFNRPEETYYVMVYDTKGNDAPYYNALMRTFSILKGKVYTMDLSEEMNKQYIKEESNKDASKPSELSLKDPTLIKIENGKISKYLDTKEDIEKEMK